MRGIVLRVGGRPSCVDVAKTRHQDGVVGRAVVTRDVVEVEERPQGREVVGPWLGTAVVLHAWKVRTFFTGQRSFKGVEGTPAVLDEDLGFIGDALAALPCREGPAHEARLLTAPGSHGCAAASGGRSQVWRKAVTCGNKLDHMGGLRASPRIRRGPFVEPVVDALAMDRNDLLWPGGWTDGADARPRIGIARLDVGGRRKQTAGQARCRVLSLDLLEGRLPYFAAASRSCARCWSVLAAHSGLERPVDRQEGWPGRLPESREV